MSRDVAVLVYGLVLGWYLHKWWQGEREYLVWSAAERAAALAAARNGGEPASETPATG